MPDGMSLEYVQYDKQYDDDTLMMLPGQKCGNIEE